MSDSDNKEQTLPSKRETLPSKTRNRVLVLGSRLSGAFELGNTFQIYLEERGIPEPEVEIQRDAGFIEKYVLGRETAAEGRKSPDLPKGVILLPEMRQYSEGGQAMFLDTYRSGVYQYVKDLCDKYKIPLIEIREYKTEDQIKDGLKKLLENPQSEK